MARLNKRYRLILKWATITLGLSAAILLYLMLFTTRLDPSAPGEDGEIQGLTSILDREVSDEVAVISFSDVTAASGIAFRHFPAKRRSLLPEDMGSGVAWGDYDGDGDDDLFLVNFSGSIIEQTEANPAIGQSALYRNDGNGQFTDVSEETGLNLAGFGMGAAWGDYDNDGDIDLYITQFGPNRLMRNDRGTFSDVSSSSGVDDDGFGASATWGDYDADGQIDLYVCNYVDFHFSAKDLHRMTRQYGSEIPYTINPSSYRPQPNRLYRNLGNGSFEERALEAGIQDPEGRSLGAVWVDFDADGDQDLYVANDVSANGVFLNMGDGTFKDIGANSLAADYRGAMGLAVGDLEHDGDFDLFVTHWVAQENGLFENMINDQVLEGSNARRLFFMDNAEMLGLGQISLKNVGWATGFADFDHDRALDLWVVNGNTLEHVHDHSQLKPQPMHLYRQDPEKGFYEVSALACSEFAVPIVGRGGAQADYDLDGKVDLAVLVHGGPLKLFHNETKNGHHWIAVRLTQESRNTQALGALVTVKTGKDRQMGQVGTAVSYLSQHSTALHFGLGSATIVDELTITWPDGQTDVHKNVEVDRYHQHSHIPDYTQAR